MRTSTILILAVTLLLVILAITLFFGQRPTKPTETPVLHSNFAGPTGQKKRVRFADKVEVVYSKTEWQHRWERGELGYSSEKAQFM